MKEVYADGVKDLRPWDPSDSGYNRELRRIVSRGTEPLSPRPVAEAKKHSQPGMSLFIHIFCEFVTNFFTYH